MFVLGVILLVAGGILGLTGARSFMRARKAEAPAQKGIWVKERMATVLIGGAVTAALIVIGIWLVLQ